MNNISTLKQNNTGIVSIPTKTQTAAVWQRIVFDPQWCRTCKLCEMVCSIFHEGESRPALARISIDFDLFNADDPIHGLVCAQCPDAACMEACPVSAMARDDVTGAVLIDDDICVGCMACQRACPWDVPKRHPEKRIALKCDMCNGRENGPICVEMCPLSGKALRIESLDPSKFNPEEVL